MNREIKFRAWAGKKKIDLQAITPLATDVPGLFIPTQSGVIIEQYTGLKDKNGVEIYEGDILSDDPIEVDGEIIREIGPVFFNKEKAAWCRDISFKKDKSEFEWLHEFIEDYEIIGNIHQNPELL